MSLVRLFLIFAKIGAILLGGGFVILPILQNEFVEKRNLLTNEELVDYFSLSQTLPGIIATNISMFIGYKLRGKLGALIAMFGVIFAPILSIIILASILDIFINNHIVKSIFWGVSAAVVALILLTIREIWQKSNRNSFFYIIFLMSLIGLLILKLSPITVIVVFSSIGVFIKYMQRRISK